MHSSTTPAEHSADTSKARRTRAAATALATTMGAAAIMTTALAAPADAKAKHHTVWDKVASCESGQRWHIDSGNGYYGGLQFSAGTWRAHGGHKYAGHADDATRKEQIEVARRVLHSQGRNAWPVCGPRAGLTRHNGHATGKKLPNKADAPSNSSAHKTTSAHKSITKHKATTKHKAKHRAAKGHHKTYRVHSGDTLSKIAHKKHVHGGWRALYQANRSHVHNPNVLHVGQQLTLP